MLYKKDKILLVIGLMIIGTRESINGNALTFIKMLVICGRNVMETLR